MYARAIWKLFTVYFELISWLGFFVIFFFPFFCFLSCARFSCSRNLFLLSQDSVQWEFLPSLYRCAPQWMQWFNYQGSAKSWHCRKARINFFYFFAQQASLRWLSCTTTKSCKKAERARHARNAIACVRVTTKFDVQYFFQISAVKPPPLFSPHTQSAAFIVDSHWFRSVSTAV